MPINTPVLFLVFNRPQLTANVFAAIKNAQPAKLFVAADGPRTNLNEDELCNQARTIATQVDWPCELYTLFRDTNLGCGLAVSSAINWFFENTEQGIILEDDCLPDESFFRFCDTLLAKYAATTHIMGISGTNVLPKGWKHEKQSYLFGHVGIWGWATWRRAWKLYDYDMHEWGTKATKDRISKAMENTNWFNYYFGMFEGTYTKKIDTWDVQWVYSIFNKNGLFINPAQNLVTNIGFGTDATHTAGLDGPYTQMESKQLIFPLKHPKKIEVDKIYLRATFKYVFEYNKKIIAVTKSWARLYLNRIRRKNSI